MSEKLLQDYVATVKSGKYQDYDAVNAKFPEFKDVDPQVLKDYVATVDSGNYSSYAEVNAKFPEFSSVGAYGNIQDTTTNPTVSITPVSEETEEVVEEPNPLEKNITNNKVKDIFAINNSITDKNEKAQKAAAESYFSLDKIPKKYENVYSPVEKATVPRVAEPTEDDIKSFFSTQEGGAEKYEEYLAYKEDGIIPDNDIFKSNFLKPAVRTEKRKGIEAYINDLNEEEVDEAILNMPDLMNMPGADADKVEKSFLAAFPEDSYYRRLYEGKVPGQPQQDLEYVKKLIVKNNPKKALSWEANYMGALNEDFTQTYKDFEKEKETFLTNNKETLDNYEKLQKEKQNLGKVTENSDTMLITMYNDIIDKQQVIQQTMEKRGVFKLQDSLIAKQNRLKSHADDLIDKSEIFNNKSLATEALVRDYSFIGRTALQLENFGQGMKVFALGGLAKIGEIGRTEASFFKPKYSKQSASDKKAISALRQQYVDAVNYKEQLGVEIDDLH